MSETSQIDRASSKARLESILKKSSGKLVLVRYYNKDLDAVGGSQSTYRLVHNEYKTEPNIVFVEMVLDFSRGEVDPSTTIYGVKKAETPVIKFIQGGEHYKELPDYELKGSEISVTGIKTKIDSAKAAIRVVVAG